MTKMKGRQTTPGTKNDNKEEQEITRSRKEKTKEKRRLNECM